MLHFAVAAAAAALIPSNGPLPSSPGRVQSEPLARFAAVPERSAPKRSAVVRPLMQQTDFYDEYVETDPKTGQQKTLSLGEKEKRYLECLDSYYNEGGKQILSNDE